MMNWRYACLSCLPVKLEIIAGWGIISRRGFLMSFKLVIVEPLDPGARTPVAATWPTKIREMIPTADVHYCETLEQAAAVIGDADAAFGDIVPELFERAGSLRWIQSPQAGPKAGYYHESLIRSEVVVTNMRGIFNDHISAHIVSYVLAFARGLHVYRDRQRERKWGRAYDSVYLPEATAVIVGVGGIGGETARLCAEFGMTVVGIDPRVVDAPPGVAELYRPDALDDVIPRADFLIVTVPETPTTQGLFNRAKLQALKPTAFFINIGRGATTDLNDLADMLEEGAIAGAALDVYEIEPLPSTHPLWELPNVIMTPHVAADGPYIDERRTDVFIDNCVRFSKGRLLRNVVDKAQWF